MPLYDLKCQNCGHEFDDLLPMKAEGPFQCPECKEYRAARVFPTRPPLIIAPQEPGSARLNRGRIRR
jgi:putative FmdB family regulatory protein